VATSRPVRVSLEALALRQAGEARTVDLSRTGARLRMPAASLEDAVAAADLVEVEVLVGDDETVVADAEVIRVDADRGELAVRFVDLAEEDAQRLDRAVLGQLSAQRGTGA
jgi:c-di-GMP-binding flagellar brake protein YcgR